MKTHAPIAGEKVSLRGV